MTTEWMIASGLLATLVLAVATAAGPGYDPIARLFAAIREGDGSAVEAMLDSDASLARARNAQQVSAVLMAIYTRHAELVPIFERHGALDIFEAAAAGRLDRLRELVATDRSLIGGYSGDGFPVLGIAAFFGRRDAVVFLLAQGADVNAAARNRQRVTALHAAVAGPDPDIARLLVEHGADPTARQEAGYTALHEVASKGLLDLARVLLAAGADAGAKNDDGVTPYDLAVRNHHDAVATLLREPVS